jgi:hypothetical protein
MPAESPIRLFASSAYEIRSGSSGGFVALVSFKPWNSLDRNRQSPAVHIALPTPILIGVKCATLTGSAPPQLL